MSEQESEWDQLCAVSLTRARSLLSTKKVSAVELVSAALRRAEDLGPQLNCHVTVLAEQALEDARRADDRMSREGALGPLHGVPISVKDNIAVANIPMTVGSPAMKNYVPLQDAKVVNRLRRAGAIILAKDNLYEFAYCAPSPVFGDTHNPWDWERACGGSSGGSAASVAARISFAAIATDGGGSIRMPASFCGVMGMKTTMGLVPRAGEFLLHPSLSTIGPIARCAEDMGTVLAAMRSEVDKGPLVAPGVVDSSADDLAGGLLSGLRIGSVMPSSGLLGPTLRGTIDNFCASLIAEGATVTPAVEPELDLARAIMWVVSGIEAAERLHETLESDGELVNPLTMSLLKDAGAAAGSLYVRSRRLMSKLRKDLLRTMASVDALVLPATLSSAPSFAPRTGASAEGRRWETLDESTRYMAIANVTGAPALVLCAGCDSDGMPIGVQLLGKPFSEDVLLRIARAYQQVQPWHTVSPGAVGPVKSA